MNWVSLTHWFRAGEMHAIEMMSAENLVASILRADPIVAMRLLAELLLHEDNERLIKLLSNADINTHWQKYDKDPEVDANDHKYAEQLKKKIPT